MKKLIDLTIVSIIVLSLVAVSTAQITPLFGVTAEHREILDHMSIVYLDDGQGGTTKTIRISDVNVQVVNGLESTETINGLGNLIVGYNEFRTLENNRTGSHSIVLGKENNYNKYASTVGGISNSVNGEYSSIITGISNVVNANGSCVIGGSENIADLKPNNSFPVSVIIGGQWNRTTSDHCVIVGGGYNFIDGVGIALNSGRWSVIVGGGGVAADNGNIISGGLSVVVGRKYHV
jgi:hypothetical protein